VRVRFAAFIDQLDEPLAIRCPGGIRTAGNGERVDGAYDLVDLSRPCSELVWENLFRVSQVGRRERDLESDARR
jgi:hypothetical protein